MGCSLCSHKSADKEVEVDLAPIAGAEDSFALPSEPPAISALPLSQPYKERQQSSGRPMSPAQESSSQPLSGLQHSNGQPLSPLPEPAGYQLVDEIDLRPTEKEAKTLEELLQRLEMQDPQTPCLEGELLRYKPAAQERYVKRWAVLTPSQFMYYKSQISALMGEKPLVTLALNKLVSVVV